MKMTAPSGLRWGSAACVRAYGARTLTRNCASKSVSGASANGFGQKMPAEWTTTFSAPKAPTASETILAGASSSARSAATT